eukprot:TRINITY_DN3102_c0_g1_i2.p1 TRINITY_DN3102_c0_g1~~TRINITY_DN3102_c0_g1_i2.p1  ORF type:complete len:317 (+),score=90.03 TRINITY_DN3102_c0_g1_i2:2-952(+)
MSSLMSALARSYKEICCPVVIDPVTLLGLLAAIAAAAAFLRIAITMNIMMRRRRKRSRSSSVNILADWNDLSDVFTTGLEDLEERIDKMVVGENQDDNSWIGSLYNKFKGAYSGQDADAQDEHGLEGLEPPNLDETWGLADTNLFHEEEGHNSTEHSRSPRSVDDEDNDNNEIPDEESIVKNMDLMDGFFTETNGCKFQLYKCIAGVVENGYHHAQKSGGVYEYAQKVLFKIAFNKGFGGGAWNAMMTAPEARKIQRCFNTQDDCLTQNILLKEVPEDSVKDSQQRLLINTEFVENLDKSNGSEPYDPENEPDYEE